MAIPVPRPFGAVLRRYRVMLGLTQEALAERAGVSRRAISDLERGVNRSPQPSTLDLLAEALQLSTADRGYLQAMARGNRLTHRPGSLPGMRPDDVVEQTPEPRSSAYQPFAAGSLLPTSPSALIGREREVELVCNLLQQPEVRLLTLTGGAGVGKTRLALAVASALAGTGNMDLQFIPLSTVNDPELVLPTVAQALGLHKTGASRS